jgi:hypothetical protein
MLDAGHVMSSYKLKEDYYLSSGDAQKRSSIHDKILARACDKIPPVVNDTIDMTKMCPLRNIENFDEYFKVVIAAREACRSLSLIPLYCYTSSSMAKTLTRKGLVLSEPGQTQIGIFLTAKSPCSLGLGTESYESNVIEYVYGSEFVEAYTGKHHVDTVLIYGAEPYCISKANPNNNRVIFIETHSMKSSNKTDENALRADRILAAMKLPSDLPIEDSNESLQLNHEMELDADTMNVYLQVELERRSNVSKESYQDNDDWLFKNQLNQEADIENGGGINQNIESLPNREMSLDQVIPERIMNGSTMDHSPFNSKVSKVTCSSTLGERKDDVSDESKQEKPQRTRSETERGALLGESSKKHSSKKLHDGIPEAEKRRSGDSVHHLDGHHHHHSYHHHYPVHEALSTSERYKLYKDSLKQSAHDSQSEDRNEKKSLLQSDGVSSGDDVINKSATSSDPTSSKNSSFEMV